MLVSLFVAESCGTDGVRNCPAKPEMQYIPITAKRFSPTPIMRSPRLCAVTATKSHSGMLISDLRLCIIPGSRFRHGRTRLRVDGDRLADRYSFAARSYARACSVRGLRASAILRCRRSSHWAIRGRKVLPFSTRYYAKCRTPGRQDGKSLRPSDSA